MIRTIVVEVFEDSGKTCFIVKETPFIDEKIKKKYDSLDCDRISGLNGVDLGALGILAAIKGYFDKVEAREEEGVSVFKVWC